MFNVVFAKFFFQELETRTKTCFVTVEWEGVNKGAGLESSVKEEEPEGKKLLLTQAKQ